MPLITELILKKENFITGAEAARLALEKAKVKVTEVSGSLALMSQAARAAGGATDELTAKMANTRKELNAAKVAVRSLSAEYVSLRANSALPPPPAAARPMAGVRQVPGMAAAGEAEHGGNNAMRNAELMHSGRAIAGELIAGTSPAQAFLMEAPRLVQALGSSLGALLVPVLALAGGGAFVKWLSDAQDKAKALRDETNLIGLNLHNVAGAGAKELAESLAAANEQVKKVQDARNSFGNRALNVLTGTGTTDRDVGKAFASRAGWNGATTRRRKGKWTSRSETRTETLAWRRSG